MFEQNSNLGSSKPQLLWTNSEQTLAGSTTIDLGDEYAYIDIEYALNGSSSYIVQRVFPRTQNQVLQGMLNMSSENTAVQAVSRSFTFDGSNVVFNSSYSKTLNNSTPSSVEGTNRCVPRKIYGYK